MQRAIIDPAKERKKRNRLMKYGNLTEEELQDLIIDAHAEFLQRTPFLIHDNEDLGFFIGVKFFENLKLSLRDDALYDGDKKVANNVKVTYNMEMFKIDLTILDPSYRVLQDLPVPKKDK